MDSSHFIKDYRHLADHFNRKEYPKLFEEVRADLEKYLEEIDEITIPDIDAILDDVEANAAKYRFGFRKERELLDDKMVLSLFVVPAAAKIGTTKAMYFAKLLSSGWEARFPGSTFMIGDYDKIASSFRKKLMIFSRQQ